MPIYEWQCERVGHVFEVLAAANAANGRRRCPSCGSNSRRVMSAVAIHRGATIMTASERASAAAVDVTDLKVPSFARPCAMDDFSASRLAAHKLGRGAEFEDKVAARALKQASRGEPASGRKEMKQKSSKPPPVSSFRGS